MDYTTGYSCYYTVNMLNNMLEDHDNFLQPVQNYLLPNILLQQAAETSINETNNAQKSFYDLSVPPPVEKLNTILEDHDNSLATCIDPSVQSDLLPNMLLTKTDEANYASPQTHNIPLTELQCSFPSKGNIIAEDNKGLSIAKNISSATTGLPKETTESNASSNKSSPVVMKFQYIGNFLSMPEAPKRKGKRNIERLPFAITSKEYKKIFEEKRALQMETERKKEERKRKREETKQNKMVNVKKTAKNCKAKPNEEKCKVCTMQL